MLSYWWKEYAECSEGPKGPPETSEATLDAESVEPFPVDEERVGVPVKGGLYEVSFGLKYLNLVLPPPSLSITPSPSPLSLRLFFLLFSSTNKLSISLGSYDLCYVEAIMFGLTRPDTSPVHVWCVFWKIWSASSSLDWTGQTGIRPKTSSHSYINFDPL